MKKKQINRKELVQRISADSLLTKCDTDKFLDSFINVVSEALANGEKVMMMNFGSFESRELPERRAKNPRTNEDIIVSRSFTPAFKASLILKERMNAEV